ncbi:DUF1330 domain-containing protein [Pseudoalteromonas sp. S16_S37]|uniref:DUF1330 domain-containing protein n=1 Tax=Pseudoalteromonas sp. S16_S37 TaxID=2720228 RepID=UPI001681853C|nr:DUF1330 domain-containing protein [Pseudoalteromonas sp. S16_S37]MBD1581388.1 DUF1330 domain-containing protein [Pseudoalteromonas sp. S16_S37]
MYEMLVGLEVYDGGIYEQYRAAMKPLLAQYEGGFGYDFAVSEVLRSEVDVAINRVFTIYFANKAKADGFFSNNDYLAIKSQYFESSVRNTVIIASYEK